MSDNNESEHKGAAPLKKPKGTVIPVHLIDKASINAAYMPFVQHGGLFIATGDAFSLGDDIFMVVRLMDSVQKYHAPGKVVWITPKGAQGGRRAGIGVQFEAETCDELRRSIETYLAGSSDDKRTDTM